ncbi:hypothetical protein G9A89_021574 [Geosiphon pyriformis]|nr:hypothetical protein G9A89_021574 [Geosiphon pyriformis]
MNNSLARHVSKVKKIPGWIISVRLLFKGRLSVTLLELYASASPGVRFDQSFKVNSLIAKAVNSSSFVVLGGDFNENGSGVGKTIDYIFVSVVSVLDFFDTDHRAVVVSVGLGGLLDAELNSMHRQANRDCWKFKIKDANCAKWAKFKNLFSFKLLLLSDMFFGAENCGNVNAIHSFKFFGLELLVIKIVKKFHSGNLSNVDCLVYRQSTLDNDKAHAFVDLLGSRVKSDVILKHLSSVHRDYRRSKIFESRLAKKASIRIAIEKCMENFCSNKGGMIKSVLERPFHKVVLDHLVVDDELVLEPEEMKSSTRKHSVHLVLPDLWARQYIPLDYVRDNAFSGVMCTVSMDELLLVIGGLLDGKAAGLSGILNELWKHGSEVVLGCLLALFNVCLSVDVVLTNTQLIALIETARKILSKILSDCILMACSKFNILQGDNFLVLKGTSTQSPVFVVGSVVENAIKKNRKVWLVLQDIWKAYNSHVKMCKRFIKFFGGIHEDRINRVMTDFGLSGDYKVHDRLDQSEVFLPLLWRIFYDLLLCKVKKHEQLCEIEGGSGLTSYFSAGAFASTQYALNIASEFFVINNIFINSKKMGVKVVLLSICGQPILIAKKGKLHHYLGIFLSTERLSKPSVAKAHANIHFFVNVVLRKAITDKQFLYLVSAVLQPIVSYRIQFSFISSSVCHKWDVLVKKCFRSKAHFPCDFPDAALYHFLLYGLKLFEQVQSEGKVAALIVFSNASGILRHLFSHRFLDLQVLGWASLDSLQFSVRLYINPVNNFLAGVVKIFLSNELSLVNNLSTAFRSSGHFFLSSILGKSLYFDSVKSLKCFGVAFGDQLFDKKGGLLDWKTFRYWKRLDPRGPVPHWFTVSSEFLKGQDFSSSCSAGSDELCSLNILGSGEFSTVKNGLHDVWSGFFEVFTDGSLRNAGSAEIASGAAAYFLVLDLSVGVAVHGLLLSIMAELQTVTLSLKCVPSSSTVVLHLDSQVAIDAYVSELSLACPDFCNQYWLKRCHIFNLIRDKDLVVSWVKMKSHSRVSGNKRADLAAWAASGFFFSLLTGVCKHFLVVESTAVSGNARHFVRDIFQSICHAHWKAGPGYDVIPDALIGCINWVVMTKVWHPNSHMLAGFTSHKSLTLCTYLIKAVHRRLPVAVRKKLYNKCYSGVLCLLCSGVEFPDHAFTYVRESGICDEILVETSAHWSVLAGVFNVFSSAVLQVLSYCSVDVELYTLVCKGFVLNDWCQEACSVFDDKKIAVAQIVDFVKFVVELHHTKMWLVRSSYQVVIEKAGLVHDGGVVSGLSHGISSILFDSVVRLLGVVKSFAICFGHHKLCCFFSGLSGQIQVNIGV